MLVARFLGDAGQFEDAEDLIKVPFLSVYLLYWYKSTDPDTLGTKRI